MQYTCKHNIKIMCLYVTYNCEGGYRNMDIERINENTFKLFITYSDIEERGYTKEDIWYSRNKGEELFWDVIGEVNTDEYFDLEGPIWIHINASESGLEVIVTRANISPDQDLEDSSEIDLTHLADIESDIFDVLEENNEENAFKNVRFKFKDIDELIPVAKRLQPYILNTSLYTFEGYYYLVVDLNDYVDVDIRKNVVFILKEYLTQSKVTVHRIEEYGQVIMKDHALEEVLQYFG